MVDPYGIVFGRDNGAWMTFVLELRENLGHDPNHDKLCVVHMLRHNYRTNVLSTR